METTQRNISVQVRFWALLGPLVALVTLMVIFVKASPQAFYLSFATILGVLASWGWKERGFLLSSLAILLLYLYQYSAITPDEHLWHVGMSLAIAIGFGITVLAYQEVDSLLEEDEESEALLELKASLQKGEETLQLVQKEIAAKQHQIESYSELVNAARQEAAKVSAQHQKLVKEFLDKQLECARLQERLTESRPLEEAVAKREEEIAVLKERLQDLEHDLARSSEEMSSRLHTEKLEYEQMLHDAHERLRDALQDKEQMEGLLMAKGQELAQKQIQIQVLEGELQKTAEELAGRQNRIQGLEGELQKAAEELAGKQSRIEELQNVQPQPSLEEVATSEMRRLEGMHKQLKQQFEDKSAALDAARKELFQTQERLFGLERTSEEMAVYGMDESTQAMHDYMKQVMRESESTIAKLEAETAHLQDLVDVVISASKS